jgi:hypothetical protein
MCLLTLDDFCFLHVRVERSFILDNGQLLVYRDHHPNAKVKAQQRWTTVNNGEDVSSENTRCGTLEHFETSSWKERFLSGLPPVIAGVAYQAMYQLKDATCFYEDRNSASLPKWMEGVVATVRCTRKEATRSTGSTWSAESTHQILGRFTVSQGFDADFQLKPIVRCRSTLFFGIHFWLLLAHFGPKLVPSHSVIMQLKMNCFRPCHRGWIHVHPKPTRRCTALWQTCGCQKDMFPYKNTRTHTQMAPNQETVFEDRQRWDGSGRKNET